MPASTGVPTSIIGSYAGVVPNPPSRPRPEPLDPPMLPFAVGGLLVWAIAGLVLLPFHGWLSDNGHTNWLWICLAGFLVGLPSVPLMLRHDANRRRRSDTADRG